MLLPILWCIFHLVKSGGNMFGGRLVERVGPRPRSFGWVALRPVYFGFGLATAAWHVWALFMAYAVFYAMTEPPEKTLVANLVPASQGLAYGWYNFAIGVRPCRPACCSAPVQVFRACSTAFKAPAPAWHGRGRGLAAGRESLRARGFQLQTPRLYRTSRFTGSAARREISASHDRSYP